MNDGYSRGDDDDDYDYDEDDDDDDNCNVVRFSDRLPIL